jgi:hypothetical protein
MKRRRRDALEGAMADYQAGYRAGRDHLAAATAYENGWVAGTQRFINGVDGQTIHKALQEHRELAMAMAQVARSGDQIQADATNAAVCSAEAEVYALNQAEQLRREASSYKHVLGLARARLADQELQNRRLRGSILSRVMLAENSVRTATCTLGAHVHSVQGHYADLKRTIGGLCGRVDTLFGVLNDLNKYLGTFVEGAHGRVNSICGSSAHAKSTSRNGYNTTEQALNLQLRNVSLKAGSIAQSLASLQNSFAFGNTSCVQYHETAQASAAAVATELQSAAKALVSLSRDVRVGSSVDTESSQSACAVIARRVAGLDGGVGNLLSQSLEETSAYGAAASAVRAGKASESGVGPLLFPKTEGAAAPTDYRRLIHIVCSDLLRRGSNRKKRLDHCGNLGMSPEQATTFLKFFEAASLFPGLLVAAYPSDFQKARKLGESLTAIAYMGVLVRPRSEGESQSDGLPAPRAPYSATDQHLNLATLGHSLQNNVYLEDATGVKLTCTKETISNNYANKVVRAEAIDANGNVIRGRDGEGVFQFKQGQNVFSANDVYIAGLQFTRTSPALEEEDRSVYLHASHIHVRPVCFENDKWWVHLELDIVPPQQTASESTRSPLRLHASTVLLHLLPDVFQLYNVMASDARKVLPDIVWYLGHLASNLESQDGALKALDELLRHYGAHAQTDLQRRVRGCVTRHFNICSNIIRKLT